MLKLRPLSNRVVVKPDPADEYTASGLHIPHVAQAAEKPQTGEVVWVGPGKVSEFPVLLMMFELEGGRNEYATEFRRMPMVLEPGMKILFGKYAGANIEIGRDKFIILRETEVLALVEEE